MGYAQLQSKMLIFNAISKSKNNKEQNYQPLSLHSITLNLTRSLRIIFPSHLRPISSNKLQQISLEFFQQCSSDNSTDLLRNNQINILHQNKAQDHHKLYQCIQIESSQQIYKLFTLFAYNCLWNRLKLFQGRNNSQYNIRENQQQSFFCQVDIAYNQNNSGLASEESERIEASQDILSINTFYEQQQLQSFKIQALQNYCYLQSVLASGYESQSITSNPNVLTVLSHQDNIEEYYKSIYNYQIEKEQSQFLY